MKLMIFDDHEKFSWRYRLDRILVPGRGDKNYDFIIVSISFEIEIPFLSFNSTALMLASVFKLSNLLLKIAIPF